LIFVDVNCCAFFEVRNEYLTLFRKRENKFRQTFEKMEGISFVTPVTGLNRPITGKEDDDDYIQETRPLVRVGRPHITKAVTVSHLTEPHGRGEKV
jgi:hypothetical protein